MRRPAAAFACIVVALLWSWAESSRPLFNPDEGRYAEIPREMLVSGEWIVPRLDGLDYIEKPPLQYWATAVAYRLFGVGEWTARLYTSLCALGTVAFVAWAARRLWTRELATRAAAIAASMLLFVLMGQLLTLDMSLTLYLTVALAAFLVAQSGARGESAERAGRSMPLAWAAVGCAVLTKGLVAILIPGAVLVLYSLYTRDWAPWRRLRLRVGIPVLLLITVPWHLLIERRMPDFADFYFLHEHLARFLTPSADREEAWWFFGPVLLLGTLPWTPAAIRCFGDGWRRGRSGEGFDAGVFLWLWVVFVVLFFSISDSKLVPYVLPALPALAILIASAPLRSQRRDLFVSAVLVGVLGLCLLGAAAALPWILRDADRAVYFMGLRPGLYAAGASLALGGAFVAVARARDMTVNTLVLGCGSLCAVLALVGSSAALAPIYSGQPIAAGLPADSGAAPLYVVGTYDQTLPFYARRTITPVSFRGELDFGLRHDPGAGIGSIEEFLVRWNADRQAFALMERSTFDALRARGVPMREVVRDSHRLLVARR